MNSITWFDFKSRIQNPKEHQIARCKAVAAPQVNLHFPLVNTGAVWYFTLLHVLPISHKGDDNIWLLEELRPT